MIKNRSQNYKIVNLNYHQKYLKYENKIMRKMKSFEKKTLTNIKLSPNQTQNK